jgi:hypothetical protein
MSLFWVPIWNLIQRCHGWLWFTTASCNHIRTLILRCTWCSKTQDLWAAMGIQSKQKENYTPLKHNHIQQLPRLQSTTAVIEMRATRMVHKIPSSDCAEWSVTSPLWAALRPGSLFRRECWARWLDKWVRIGCDGVLIGNQDFMFTLRAAYLHAHLPQSEGTLPDTNSHTIWHLKFCMESTYGT